MLANDLPVYWTNTLPYHTIYSKKVGNPPMGIWATSSPMDMTYKRLNYNDEKGHKLPLLFSNKLFQSYIHAIFCFTD